MRILILNWKDLCHPAMGGAEVLTHAIAERWTDSGHEVTIFAAHFPGAASDERINGVRVVRGGNRFTVYWHAASFVRKRHRQFDRIIDQINTLPFGTPLYAPKHKRVMLIHQLAREVWFYELPTPLAWLGALVEPLMLKLYRQEKTITVSESTRQDLLALGFRPELVRIIPEGIDVRPVTEFEPKVSPPTFLFAGRLTPMKRVDHVIEAFRLAKQRVPAARLSVVGSGRPEYVAHLEQLAADAEGVVFHGRVSQEEKRRLMKEAWVIVGASVREGWGLFVSEGAALGTPSVVYNVPGLRDSTINGVTGLVTQGCHPAELADQMVRMVVDTHLYDRCRYAAWNWAKTLTWDQAAGVFAQYLSEG